MTDDDLEDLDFCRVDTLFPCPTCGRPAVDHKHSEHLGWQDQPFLRRLCDGSLVKT